MEINPETLEIEIVDVEPIEGGIQVFARAWSDGEQIGFGADGTVDIERFRIFNPPILVPDSAGEIASEIISPEGDVTFRLLREDLEAALLQSLGHTILQVGKDGSGIVTGKVGNTTSTFYSAAGAVSPVDGTSNYFNSTSWATTRNAATADSASATTTTMNLRNFYGNGNGATFFTIHRAFHLFDTSAIPDADVISSATLSVYGFSKTVAGAEERFYVVASTPASNANVTTADYDQLGAVSFGVSGTTFSTTGYNDVTLNSSGLTDISKTSITKFGIRGAYDFNNITPDAGNDYDLSYYFADQAGTSTDPKLVVEHAAAASTFRPRIIMY